MKDVVIISVYDSCVDWSIFIDGYIIDREELEYPHKHFPKGLRQIARETYNAFCWGFSEVNEIDYLCRKFSNYYSIILCEDGGIEIIK